MCVCRGRSVGEGVCVGEGGGSVVEGESMCLTINVKMIVNK